MRSRASALMLAPLVALALAPAAAHAADTLSPYKAQVTAAQAADLKTQGFDIQEANVSTDDGPLQDVELIASDSQVKDLAADGIDLAPLAIDKPVAKSAALGSSPNPFFNVYRSYMEPGGIADEMKALAAANPDVMKLEQYGTSTLGKPLYTIKMTANARNVADGARPAILFSAVNHAREWIAAEMGRRLPIWFAEHKNDPEIQRMISDRELWFVPIQNPDGYDFTFTCGTGAAQVPCDYRVRTADDNRFWRKTLRDNNANGIYGDGQDGVDPNRNYPSKRGIDEEGASNSFNSETYRGPYALSEPEDLGIDRLQRRIGFGGQHQLPLRGPAAADAGLLHDRLLPARLDAVRRRDRHRRRRGRVPVPLAALVGPLRVQRRHHRQRVHELRHHRLDAGDGHVRHAR
jgi:hypothetical protein